MQNKFQASRFENCLTCREFVYLVEENFWYLISKQKVNVPLNEYGEQI